jgi:hypothetical protein
MKFLSLKPFVPSGNDFERSTQFFVELGFKISWEDSNYVDFEKDGCKFLLQRFDKPEFAQNYMLTVSVDNAEQFRSYVLDKKLSERFGIRIGEVTQRPYGKEVNIIDVAGVCWHFVEQ